MWAGEMGGNLLDLLTKHFLAFLVQMFNMHANESILYVSYPVKKTHPVLTSATALETLLNVHTVVEEDFLCNSM